MNRRSTIAATGAAAGVLIAGTIAGVAIVKAANTHPVTEQVMLVADTSAEPVAAPSFAPSALPDVQLPATNAPTATQSPAAKPTTAPVAETKPIVTRVQARQAVLAQAAGTVLSVHLGSHGGYQAYAVKVQRADGSVVIGYVDAASGVVFDWTDVSGPTPVTTTTTSGDDHDGEHEDSTDASNSEHDHDSDDD